MCHMSNLMCDMSCVVSPVPCHFFSFSFLDKVVKLVGGGSVIHGATPSNVRAGHFTIRH